MDTNHKLRVLIFGASGMLGHKLHEVLLPEYEILGTIRGDADIFRRTFGLNHIIGNVDVLKGDEAKVLYEYVPDVVINCIGITDKRVCTGNPVMAVRVNSTFPRELNVLCQKINAKLIHISTDCVFSGTKGGYKENDRPNADDTYGNSKHWGEVTDGNALTIRTSFIGKELVKKRGLLEWFLSHKDGEVEGFTNVIFSGFPTIVLARIIRDYIIPNKKLCGLYHVASAPISKYDLLNLLNEALDLGIKIKKDNTVRCDRSLNSTKFNWVTGFEANTWLTMVAELVVDLAKYKKFVK